MRGYLETELLTKCTKPPISRILSPLACFLQQVQPQQFGASVVYQRQWYTSEHESAIYMAIREAICICRASGIPALARRAVIAAGVAIRTIVVTTACPGYGETAAEHGQGIYTCALPQGLRCGWLPAAPSSSLPPSALWC